VLLERKKTDIDFPLVILTASWWHNDLYVVNNELINNLKNLETEQVWPFFVTKIWYTLDDAAWEAFDKVSKMLGWPYPWWPWISSQALKWKSNEKFQFKRIFLPLKNNQIFEFSFSWMKSQVLQLLSHIEKEWKTLTEQDISDIAYEFQEATVETLWKRLIRAAKMYGAKTIAIAGWVSANKRLAWYVEELVEERNSSDYAKRNKLYVNFLHPVKNLYSTDNWAMIWVAGLLANEN
jgi:N6-L-threonylcarbamoyladenine synthase